MFPFLGQTDVGSDDGLDILPWQHPWQKDWELHTHSCSSVLLLTDLGSVYADVSGTRLIQHFSCK